MSARLPPSAARNGDKTFDWPAIRSELKSPLFCMSSILVVFRTDAKPGSYGLAVHFLAGGTSGLTFWLPTIIQVCRGFSSSRQLPSRQPLMVYAIRHSNSPMQPKVSLI